MNNLLYAQVTEMPDANTYIAYDKIRYVDNSALRVPDGLTQLSFVLHLKSSNGYEVIRYVYDDVVTGRQIMIERSAFQGDIVAEGHSELIVHHAENIAVLHEVYTRGMQMVHEGKANIISYN